MLQPGSHFVQGQQSRADDIRRDFPLRSGVLPQRWMTDPMATRVDNLPQRHKLTVTDYYRLATAGSLTEDDRVELIDGDIIDMTPIGSLHASIVDDLARLLQLAVGEAARVRVQGPVRLGEFSEPEPDIVLLRPREDSYRSSHPGPADVLLIVEVADSSLVYDRDTKVPLYARHGIAEVWLVDAVNRRLVIHREPGPGRYRVVVDPAPLGETSISELPGKSVDLSGLF